MIDKTKKHKTRDGREVIIYSTEAGGLYPVHGAIKQSDNTWLSTTWTVQGLSIREETGVADLIEVKTKGWINIYEGDYFTSKREADAEAGAASSRIACVQIEFTKGQGVNHF